MKTSIRAMMLGSSSGKLTDLDVLSTSHSKLNATMILKETPTFRFTASILLKYATLQYKTTRCTLKTCPRQYISKSEYSPVSTALR